MELSAIKKQINYPIYYEEPRGFVINADCLDIMKRMPDKCVDMILCDLPYGITACKWDTIIPFESLWEQYKRIVKDNAAIVLTATQPFATDLINSNRKWFRYEWIWNKIVGANFMNLKNRPLNTHELILIFSKSANIIFNPIAVSRSEASLRRVSADKMRKIPRKKGKNDKIEHYGVNKNQGTYFVPFGGMKHPIDIIEYSIFGGNDRYRFRHPTRKPVELFEYLIKTYTNAGDIVIDNCIGSGTTAVAAKKLGRRWIGCEISEKYCAIVKQRLMAIPDNLFDAEPPEAESRLAAEQELLL